MASVSDFQTRFPEFCDQSDSRIQLFLNDTALLMASETKWLGFYDVAQQYYTAHFLVVADTTESGDTNILAPVKHQEVDDVTIKSAIGDVSPTFDELNSTSYGKRYISYRKIVFTGMYGV
jgi:hypothetical protein